MRLSPLDLWQSFGLLLRQGQNDPISLQLELRRRHADACLAHAEYAADVGVHLKDGVVSGALERCDLAELQ